MCLYSRARKPVFFICVEPRLSRRRADFFTGHHNVCVWCAYTHIGKIRARAREMCSGHTQKRTCVMAEKRSNSGDTGSPWQHDGGKKDAQARVVASLQTNFAR